MIQTSQRIEIEQDGAVLVGSAWVVPEDYEDEDDALGLLPGWKGMTPIDWPTMQASE